MSELFIDEKGRIYKKIKEGMKRLSIFDGSYYSLRAVNGIPMLEIDGIRMHLIKDFKTPIDYSKYIVGLLKIKSGARVLDTCGGLGYTAIAAAEKGAIVASIEISKQILNLANENPHSRKYFTNPNIHIYNADSSELIKTFDSDVFDVVLHDPPTLSRAPALYTISFYKQVYRVLKTKGVFYHYLGNPNSKYKHRNIYEKTISKLKQIGFYKFKIDKKAQALLSIK